MKLKLTLACLAIGTFVRGQDYLTPRDVVVPPEHASQEALSQTAEHSALRFAGMDVFPHAALTALYDDNVLITHDNAISDVMWTVAPGVTVAAGDLSTVFPGSITLEQVRGLLDYSLVDDSAQPQRFLAADYTPGINLFTRHDDLDNVDHSAGLAAGYAFARLALGLDEDYSRLAVKDNEIGSRVTRSVYNTKFRSRYELTDRSRVEVNLRYYRVDYENEIFQGYQEVHNEDWFSRLIGARLEGSVGAAFGFVYPQVSPSQTYQQMLLRGNYRLSGKLNLRSSLGLELREYESGRSDTVDPVFSLAAVYLPRPTTVITFEGHRRDQPSYNGDYNYTILGVSLGGRQQLTGHLFASVNFGYDNTDYVRLNTGASNNRSDGYLSGRVAVDYEFNRRLTSSLFYIRQQNDSNIERFTFGDNLVGAQVSWRL